MFSLSIHLFLVHVSIHLSVYLCIFYVSMHLCIFISIYHYLWSMYISTAHGHMYGFLDLFLGSSFLYLHLLHISWCLYRGLKPANQCEIMATLWSPTLSATQRHRWEKEICSHHHNLPSFLSLKAFPLRRRTTIISLPSKHWKYI